MLHFFKHSNGTTKQLVFANDDDYFYLTPSSTTATAWTSIGDYGTAVTVPNAYTLKDYVIFGTGLAGNSMKKWNGSAFSNVTSAPVGGYDLLFYEFFQGQDFAALFGAGDVSNPSRLYYSDASNPDAWSGGASGYIDIALSDGEKITGLKQQGDQLIIYKNKHRYFLSTFYESGAGVYGVRVQPYRDNSGGTIAHDTVQVLPNGDIVALADKLNGLQGFGKLQSADGSLVPKDYSRDLMPMFENINWNYAYKARAIIWDGVLFLAVPYGPSATSNNYVFCLDYRTNGWSVIPDLSVSAWEIGEDSNGNEVLFSGDAEQPKIYVWDKNTYTDNGELIQGRMRSGKLNLGSIIDYEKDVQVVALEGFMQEGDELLLKFIADGTEESYTITDTFIANSSGGAGTIANDYIAEEYIPADGSDLDTSQDVRWKAILLVNTEQRRLWEIEVQVENQNAGANWGWNHLSIDEISFEEARLIPQQHIINTSATI
jgi:hypothetical protein